MPFGPVRVEIGKAPKVEDFDLDGDEPVVNVVAPATNDLTLRGTIAVKGSDKDSIFSTYISPLLALRGTSVSVSDPSGNYDGTYFVADFKPTDVSQGAYVRFEYVLTLRVVTSVNVL